MLLLSRWSLGISLELVGCILVGFDTCMGLESLSVPNQVGGQVGLVGNCDEGIQNGLLLFFLGGGGHQMSHKTYSDLSRLHAHWNSRPLSRRRYRPQSYSQKSQGFVETYSLCLDSAKKQRNGNNFP